MNTRHWLKRIILGVVALTIVSTGPAIGVWADSNEISFSLSPMNQSIVLNPGSTYHGSFKIVNPNTSNSDLTYEIERKSFYVDDSYETTFDEVSSPIVDWTTMNSPETGTLQPNSNINVEFTIEVPDDVAGGGQYEAFLVKTRNSDDPDGGTNNKAAIKEQLIMAHLVFAEVAGDTLRQGEVTDINVPSFLLSGNITGSSSIENTGNIHGTATYKLQVFPLFSSEEVYTNEEDPETHIILPDRTLYNETTWDATPDIGIFNVVYTVEFEGVTAQVSKMVIKCPVWLLFIIFFIIAAIIIWIIMRVRHHSKSKERKAASAE